MKNKIVFLILSLIFIVTISITAIFVKKIYQEKIIPVNEKIAIYEKLEKKENKIDKKIQNEIRESKNIQKQTKENQNTKQELEKKLNKYQVTYNKKVIYLTFDDGPSEYTMDILNTLDKYNIKATFFVTCSDNLENISKEIIKRGHTIALHTCTHKYSYVYSSDEAYFEDLNNISNLVYKYTGIKSKYVRLPGGSSNTVSRAYNLGIMSRLSSSLHEKGYKYYDWNIDSNDAGGANSEQEYSNVIGALQNSDRDINMVLMHDTKVSTKDSLDGIIKDALNLGYTFSNINEYTIEVHHGINN